MDFCRLLRAIPALRSSPFLGVVPAALDGDDGDALNETGVRRCPDGHQTQVLTSRADTAPAAVACRMANRWRQENYFNYAGEHFALDDLIAMPTVPTTRAALVPTGKGARAPKRWSSPLGTCRRQGGLADAIDDAGARAGWPGGGTRATVCPAVGRSLARAEADLAGAKTASACTPSHLPLSAVPPGSRLLETDRKLLTHAIRMSAEATRAPWPRCCTRTTRWRRAMADSGMGTASRTGTLKRFRPTSWSNTISISSDWSATTVAARRSQPANPPVRSREPRTGLRCAAMWPCPAATAGVSPAGWRRDALAAPGAAAAPMRRSPRPPPRAREGARRCRRGARA